ncbi:MAG TPA: Spx/MgsR family RNA polymerase-binding regulatory protein [Dokdonella sp.]|uniref:Spx/MgsR family RNA polymerase-binding regulatory protein n=1 Tax=Dokdonella sp. TaxID=2291710 RepID=UPI002D7F8469|nr:Spx/MgsR family RNA polymerase-binding regulatory protein [Dokdonella sp.]HET9034020.1 Spx/MgsR family RNA polymerase-binding regulatory protein [Dokdonella sp.]
MSIDIYGLNNCDTCRKARKWLDRHAIEHRFIDYRDEPATPAMLKAWAEAVGGFDALINRSSTTWRKLAPTRKSPGSAAEWNLLIREYPALVKRPVLVFADGRVQLGFNDKVYVGLFSPTS